ncbi:hypothetical protein [Rhodococcus jostii]|uniref:hypothetical protein n=1 Tax=Rhodococcus jostii TaxID=132919 RepID=UPI003634E3FF
MYVRSVVVDTAARLGVRWVLITAATVLAFWRTWQQVWSSTIAGTAIGYVFVLPGLAVCAAVGVTLRRAGELPIHDRQTDKIVGGLGVVITLGIRFLLVPRFAEDYQRMQLDVSAAWLFALSAAILVFGIRPVARYWPVWLLIVTMSPLLYRTLAILLGGQRSAFGLIMVATGAATTAIAVARTRTRAAAGFVCTLVIGTSMLVVIDHLYPRAPLLVLQTAPALGATIAVQAAFYLHHRRGRTKAPLQRPVRRPTTINSGLTFLAVFTAAATLSAIPLPDQHLIPVSHGPPPTSGPGLLMPAGWTQLAISDYQWPQRYFGPESQLSRQTLRADEPRPGWDQHDRLRTVQVDALTVANPAALEVYPGRTFYPLQNARVSPATAVDVGRGVTAEMYTVVDDTLLLTWSNLSFIWTRGPDIAQRVTLISVDNHDPGAYFPEPSPPMASNAANTLTVLFRGTLAVTDTSPNDQDQDLLTTLARDLVITQYQPGPG